MNVHHLQLAALPFSAIASGMKTIESRLYDEKRQAIQLGDTIIFINREDINQSIAVSVVDLLRHKTFHDLFSHGTPQSFGGQSVAWLEEQISDFYSIDEQRMYGVVGIVFEKL